MIRTMYAPQELRYRTGFTIVELLIVIVVIAILAAISIITYSGIQSRTADSAVQAAVGQAYKHGQLAGVEAPIPSDTQATLDWLRTHYQVEEGNYKKDEPYPIVVGYTYDQNYNRTGYKIAAVSKSGKVFVATQDSGAVVRSVTNWTEYVGYLQGELDYWTEQLSDSESWCVIGGECQGYVDYYQAALQKAISESGQGGDMWSDVRYSSGGCGAYGESVLPYVYFAYKKSTHSWIFMGDDEDMPREVNVC